MSIREAGEWFATLPEKLTAKQNEIATRILKEIRDRLKFLNDVGLDYLALSRNSGTLSGGESQRIRLASQIGSGLTGVLYVLDEPSIGLHQRDNARLLVTLKHLRDLGNSVIVVEHDEEAILHGRPCHRYRAGRGRSWRRDHRRGHPRKDHGDRVESDRAISERRAAGSPCPRTGANRPKASGCASPGATGNNLKNVTADIPLGTFTCVTGVSGGGKSTLLIETIYKAVARRLNGAREAPSHFDDIQGLEYLDKVIDIDQSPIGRTPRSNPATYTGAFTPIRDWFAGLPEAKARGYCRAASPSTSRAGAAKPARATASSRSKCTSCPTSTSPATSARASATIARRWKSCSAASPSPMCWI